MKYIVKKELPGAKVGDILTLDGGDIVDKDRDVIVTPFKIIPAIDQGFIEPYEERPKKVCGKCGGPLIEKE